MSSISQQHGDNTPESKGRIERFFAQLPHTDELPKELPGFWYSDGNVMDVTCKLEGSGEQKLLSLNIVVDEIRRLIVDVNLRTAEGQEVPEKEKHRRSRNARKPGKPRQVYTDNGKQFDALVDGEDPAE